MWKYSSTHSRQYIRYQTGKPQAWMAYTNFSFKNSPSSTIDWLLKWIYAYRKLRYPNRWPKERPLWSRNTSSKEPPQITCLLMMWKILMAQNREEIYESLIYRGLFPEEQNGCHKGNRDREELLYIDQHIINDSKTRRKNLTMAWIDYKKAYDMIPQSWTAHCFKMNKMPDEVIKFIEKNNRNMVSRIDSRRKNLSRSEDPERYIPGWFTITITICNSDNATQLHSQEMHIRTQTL